MSEKQVKVVSNNMAQEKSDARNELDAMKETQKDFDSRKRKSNKIMLDTIPKMVCFAMVAIVLILVAGSIVIMIIGEKNNVDMSKLLSSNVEGGIVTTGVAVIGIAVSVWVGLNIYLSLSKEESEKLIQKMESEITNIEKCLNDVDDTLVFQKGIMWQEFINLLDSQRNENMLSAYFAYQFSRLFDEEKNADSLTASLIYKLMQYENECISITRMYENGEKENCFALSENFLDDVFMNENIGGTDEWKKTFSFYFDIHIADVKFYKNAVCLRSGKHREDFSMLQMEDVCVKYKNVLVGISSTAREYADIKSAKAYINNTIGYTLDLINQYEGVTAKNKERRENANKHMREAVNLLEDQFFEKKARYLRNLGLTYERLGDLDKAYKAYVESIKEDMSDYKSWNTCGSIILKKFESEHRIFKRGKLLSVMQISEPKKWEDELLKAKTQFEMSASEGKGFEDPYYKLIQVYTYLYMLGNEKSETRKGAEKYMNILNMMEYTGGGSMYAYRNYYEVIGDIEKASEINAKIKVTPNNDVEHMRKLYLNEIKSDEDI